jgi:hypothetical protein
VHFDGATPSVCGQLQCRLALDDTRPERGVLAGAPQVLLAPPTTDVGGLGGGGVVAAVGEI